MASSETITSENFGESSMIDNNRVMAEEARGNTFEQVKVILEGPILDRFKTESNKAEPAAKKAVGQAGKVDAKK